MSKIQRSSCKTEINPRRKKWPFINFFKQNNPCTKFTKNLKYPAFSKRVNGYRCSLSCERMSGDEMSQHFFPFSSREPTVIAFETRIVDGWRRFFDRISRFDRINKIRRFDRIDRSGRKFVWSCWNWQTRCFEDFDARRWCPALLKQNMFKQIKFRLDFDFDFDFDC